MRLRTFVASLAVAAPLLAIESGPASACGWLLGGYGYGAPASYDYYGYAPRAYSYYGYGPGYYGASFGRPWGWRGYGYRGWRGYGYGGWRGYGWRGGRVAAVGPGFRGAGISGVRGGFRGGRLGRR
jgi:hypothetical protein